ncbi:MAG: hypothetical protein CME62_00100 [Halobacteriovoraceae bacterium]|nr:hypothetical protein [Halobacteriovoraceae bacterium]|tara:strand:+ start:2956 stop:3948 length:993 start_codon:yes stop_codon:yes gene_type:complete
MSDNSPKLKRFANPKEFTKSWYLLGKSKSLKPGNCELKKIFDKQFVVFRTESGVVHVMEARCPHMGAMLGAGEVVGECIRCPFHHWEFDGEGECTKVPYLDEPPARAKVKSYPVKEVYGGIWFFYGDEPLYPLPHFENLAKNNRTVLGPRRELVFHPHLIYPNTVDFNHWWAVHGIIVDRSSDFESVNKYQTQIELFGRLVDKPQTLSQKTFKFFRKTKFHWKASSFGGNVFLAEMILPIQFKFMLTYLPKIDGGCEVQTIYFFENSHWLKRVTGISLLTTIWKAFFVTLLFYDDMKIMNTIEFQTNFTKEDKLIGKWIQHVQQLDYVEK